MKKFTGTTIDRERCPYVFMANSITDMEEWVRALRRVIGAPTNGGSVSLFTVMETEVGFFKLFDILVKKCIPSLLELDEKSLCKIHQQLVSLAHHEMTIRYRIIMKYLFLLSSTGHFLILTHY